MYKEITSKQRDVMVQCLLLANHSSAEWEWESQIFKCNPGQFVTSLNTLTKNCAKDVKVQSVRTSLLKLEKWGFLTNTSTKTGRLITISNWKAYQIDEEEDNKEPNKASTKHQQSTNKALTTNKNVKNVENNKEVYMSYVLLTTKEHNTLTDKYGKFIIDKYIDKLNDYIGMIGVKKANAKYISHNAVINSWIKKDNVNPQPKKEVIPKEEATMSDADREKMSKDVKNLLKNIGREV